MSRELTYVEAIQEATDQEMALDPSVVVFGLDVDDPREFRARPGDWLRSTVPSVCSVPLFPKKR